jgi:hypothetical protein
MMILQVGEFDFEKASKKFGHGRLFNGKVSLAWQLTAVGALCHKQTSGCGTRAL